MRHRSPLGWNQKESFTPFFLESVADDLAGWLAERGKCDRRRKSINGRRTSEAEEDADDDGLREREQGPP